MDYTRLYYPAQIFPYKGMFLRYFSFISGKHNKLFILTTTCIELDLAFHFILQVENNMEDEPVVYKADPLWLHCVENMYKMLFVFISSINYYIYCWKLLILKGKCSTCCRPKKSFTQGENIQLQLTMSKKSTRGSSGT